MSDLFNYSKTDVDWELARRAHSGTSFIPEKRADGYVSGYMADMQQMAETFGEFVTDENREAIAADLEKYRLGYLKRMNAFLHAHSRVMSTMITGPANFPVERNRKRGDTADRRRNEWLDWDNKFTDRMRSNYDPKRLANAPISADDGDAIEKLRAKIAQAEQMQEQMKAGNKIVRSKKLTDDEKREQLAGLDFGDSLVHEFMTGYLGKVGIPQFTLTNNSANIRRLKQRVEGLERERARPSADDYEVEVDGMMVTVSENTAENRLQLFFDDKPPVNVRSLLKSNGFRWTPSQGAWQRQLNNNARTAVRRLLGGGQQ